MGAGSSLAFSVLREMEKDQFSDSAPCFPGDHSFGDCFVCTVPLPTPLQSIVPSLPPWPFPVGPEAQSLSASEHELAQRLTISCVLALSLLRQGHGSGFSSI